MLFNRSVFKTFYRALVDGVFNQPVNVGEIPPPEFIYLIDNAGDQLISNDGDELIANN